MIDNMFVCRPVISRSCSLPSKRLYTTEQPFQLSLSIGRRKTAVFRKTFSSQDYEFPDELYDDFKSFFSTWPSELNETRVFSKHEWCTIQEIMSQRSCDWIVWQPKRLSQYHFGLLLSGDKKPFRDECERFDKTAALTDRYVRLTRYASYGIFSDRTFSAEETNESDGVRRLRAFFNAEFQDLWWGRRNFIYGERLREILPATRPADYSKLDEEVASSFIQQ